METLLWLVPALLVGAGILFLVVARLYASRTGIASSADVKASDTSQNRVARLEDPDLGIRGQPDYIMERRAFPLLGPKRLFPVELKTGTRSKHLRDSDRLQAVVYLLLMRRVYGRRAARVGYVRYATGTFPVRLDRSTESECLRVVALIRQAREVPDVRRNHESPARCRGCGVRRWCDQSLV